MSSKHALSSALGAVTVPLVLPAKTPTHQNDQSSSDQSMGFQFLKLPVEIRLMIYEEVTAPSVGAWPALCCLNYRQHTPSCPEEVPHLLAKAIFPAILQTNRMVLREGLPILYSTTAFNILCNECIAERSKSAVPSGSLIDRLVVCERPLTGTYIKYATIRLFPCYESFDRFPNTWRKLEPKILAVFDNLAQITLHLMPYRIISIKMVRQRYRLKAEYLHRVRDSLKSSSSIQGHFYPTEQMVRLCDALILSDCPSPFDDTMFGIRSIKWVEWERPGREKEIKRTYYLRCDEDTNDDSIVSTQSYRGVYPVIPEDKHVA